MGFSWEMVAVGLLVVAAGAWAVRSLVRSMRKPGGCSSCGSSGACPAAKGPGAGDCRTGAEAVPTDSRRGASIH